MKVAAVIVTFNGINYLKKCLQAVKAQTRLLDEIIVVNNSSTDGTTEWLNGQNNVRQILQPNSGSSGGEYTGIKTAFEEKYDWVWCLDQDIIPRPDALEKLLNSEEASLERIGFLASLVLDQNNNISYINVPFIRNFEEVLDSISKNKNLPIISSSFGSVLFSRKVIEEVGYPFKKLFIWGDDVEYTMRMIRNNWLGFLILSSIVIHDQTMNSVFPLAEMDLKSNKTKYAIRNSFYVFRLRNKILYNSSLREILGINFLRLLIRKRAEYSGKIDLKYFFVALYNLFVALFTPIIKKKYN